MAIGAFVVAASLAAVDVAATSGVVAEPFGHDMFSGQTYSVAVTADFGQASPAAFGVMKRGGSDDSL